MEMTKKIFSQVIRTCKMNLFKQEIETRYLVVLCDRTVFGSGKY